MRGQSLIPIFVTLMTAIIHLSLSCEFPLTVQTNVTSSVGDVPRDWRGRIKSQYADYTLRIEISRNVLRVISSDTTSVRSHNRACVRAQSGNKFIVAHEEAGQVGTKFSCIQFVHRSRDVIQIRSAPLGDKLDLGQCAEDRLQLDKWLIIDHAHIGRDPQTCPLQGGYVLGLYDKIRSQSVCDAWRGEVRLESECAPGDGFTFYFRVQKCVPEDLMMYSTQPVLCVATWRSGEYDFTLLRHNDPSLQYFWVFRVRFAAQSAAEARGEGFTSFLFKDLIAESVEYSTDTINYIRMDMTRDVEQDVTKLCSDEYEICSSLKAPCSGREANLALTCPRTCGVCTSTSHSTCSLPSEWAGQWLDGGTGGPAGNQVRSAVIDDSTISVQSGNDSPNATYRCVRWDTARQTSAQMLVQTFSGGCRPRYTCAKVIKRSASLLYLRLSILSMWPITKSRVDAIDCDAFTYEQSYYGSAAAAMALEAATKNSLLLYPQVAESRSPVDCNFPEELVNFNMAVRDAAGAAGGVNDCNATVSAAGQGTRVQLKIFTGCRQTNEVTNASYTCLLSSSVNTSSRDLMIISEKITPNGGDIQYGGSPLYCWLFPKSATSEKVTMFYLLNGTQCHQVTQVGTRLDNIQQYIAVFTARPRRSSSPKISPVRSTSIPPTSSPRRPPPQVSRETQYQTNFTRDYRGGRTEGPPQFVEDSNPNIFVVVVVQIIFAVIQALSFCKCLF